MQLQRPQQTPGERRLPGPGTTQQVLTAALLGQIRLSRDNKKQNISLCNLCPASVVFFLFLVHMSVVVVLITFWLLSLIHSSLLGFSIDRPGRRPALFPWGGVTAWCLKHQVTIHWLRSNTEQHGLGSVMKAVAMWLWHNKQHTILQYFESINAITTSHSRMALL